MPKDEKKMGSWESIGIMQHQNWPARRTSEQLIHADCQYMSPAAGTVMALRARAPLKVGKHLRAFHIKEREEGALCVTVKASVDQARQASVSSKSAFVVKWNT